MEQKSMEWVFLPGLFGGGHYELKCDGYHVSYNPDISAVLGGFENLAADDDSGETALCKGGKYYILNGDWRAEYERLVPKGWAECFAFYEAKKHEHKSSWSNET